MKVDTESEVRTKYLRQVKPGTLVSHRGSFWIFAGSENGIFRVVSVKTGEIDVWLATTEVLTYPDAYIKTRRPASDYERPS